jgi:P-type E1-E2 ATPase
VKRIPVANKATSAVPGEKVEFVRDMTTKSRTMSLGDGINDAPAMMAATAGIALGVNSDITAEAAGAVILQSSLKTVDELLHIGRRMRGIAITSAAGGMGLSPLECALRLLAWLVLSRERSRKKSSTSCQS